jgi:hypothetical protein
MRRKLIRLAFFAIFILFCTADHAQAHSVALSWTASADPGVSYNIYRLSGACLAASTSGFSKITATPLTATTYTDSIVTPGTYCYYATSVFNGAESVPSNLAPAVILPAAPTAVATPNLN